MKSSNKRTPLRHGLGTAEASPGRVDKEEVADLNEDVADRQAAFNVKYRENVSNSREVDTHCEAFTK